MAGEQKAQEAASARQRVAMEYQYYQSQMQEVQRQLETVEMSIQETADSITALGSLDPDSPLMFPLGGGVLIKVKVADKEKVLVDAGARVFSEKMPEEAKAILTLRKEKLENASKRLRQDASELLMRLSDLRSKLEVQQ